MEEAACRFDSCPQNNRILSWIGDVAATASSARKRAAATMSSPPRSPSPKKRQRRQPGANDYGCSLAHENTRSAPNSDRQTPEETAATPRPLRGRTLAMVAPPQPTPPRVASPSSQSAPSLASSSFSQRSRTSASPRKRALALLQADDLPVTSKPIAAIHSHADLTEATRHLL